jgi:hypothetical protein
VAHHLSATTCGSFARRSRSLRDSQSLLPSLKSGNRQVLTQTFLQLVSSAKLGRPGSCTLGSKSMREHDFCLLVQKVKIFKVCCCFEQILTFKSKGKLMSLVLSF